VSKRLPFMGVGWVAARRTTCLCDYHLRAGVESRAAASLAASPLGKTVTGAWSSAEEDALRGFFLQVPQPSVELIGRHLCRAASSVSVAQVPWVKCLRAVAGVLSPTLIHCPQ
jgi:hypothetical protein